MEIIGVIKLVKERFCSIYLVCFLWLKFSDGEYEREMYFFWSSSMRKELNRNSV